MDSRSRRSRSSPGLTAWAAARSARGRSRDRRRACRISSRTSVSCSTTDIELAVIAEADGPRLGHDPRASAGAAVRTAHRPGDQLTAIWGILALRPGRSSRPKPVVTYLLSIQRLERRLRVGRAVLRPDSNDTAAVDPGAARRRRTRQADHARSRLSAAAPDAETAASSCRQGRGSDAQSTACGDPGVRRCRLKPPRCGVPLSREAPAYRRQLSLLALVTPRRRSGLPRRLLLALARKPFPLR